MRAYAHFPDSRIILGLKKNITIDFSPKAGTILLYQGAVIHGGAEAADPSVSRKSITGFFITKRGYTEYHR
ncbi:MAG: hypothetical protein K2W94_05930 [Alphaproteobacteria bacterium]|nr:hypothetical protein [Alphaproteobacteria bacterium]